MKKILLVSCLLAVASAGAAELSLSKMEDGDRVELTRHSSGCFHNSFSYYEVRKVKGSYKFRQHAIIRDEEKPAKILKKEMLGEIILGPEDVKGLDQLLQFYRSEKSVFSTTQVSLLVEYFDSDRRVKIEQLEDVSGGYELEKRKGLVQLGALAERFRIEGSEGDDVEPLATPTEKKPEDCGARSEDPGLRTE